MSATILIVDDEESILKTLAGILEDEGYKTMVACDGVEALAVVQREVPDLVMLDIWMPRMEGLETLKRLKELYPELLVVMMSGHGTIETAVKSTKMGAYDFIEKPLSLEKIILTVNNALGMQLLRQENASLRDIVLQDYRVVGVSPSTARLREQIALVALTDTPVLISGENGTGKELLARALHMQSSRRSRPFVHINCAALPEELIEYELFGHEKGAFAGAATQKKGRFELADAGTIFLEEIGELSPKTQAKLLRFLEERKFERFGGARSIEVDVRVVAASSRNLEEVKGKSFREDLFYQLNVVALSIPPLRERKEDIPSLVDHFIELFCRREGREAKTMSPEAAEMMKRYDWPGNVRELKNIMERLVILTPASIITLNHIPDYICAGPEQGELARRHDYPREVTTLRAAREEFEKEFIIRKLEENGWNISATADLIELERSILQRKIRTYGIGLKRAS